MAAGPTRSQARQFALLLSEMEPSVRRGFMASVTDLQANVDWQSLLDGLAQLNIDAAVEALNIEPAAWAQYSAAVTDVFARSGASTAAIIRAQGMAPIGVRFDIRNPIAEQWIRESVATSVTGFVEEQVKAARALIEEGYAAGKGPRSIALDLVGRTTPTGGRSGGIMGLDAPRARRYSIVSEAMRTAEGVASIVVERADGSIGLRYTVNRATHQRIVKAYLSGSAVPEAQRKASETQFKNALLKERAETVARTETAAAVMGGRETEWRIVAADRGMTGADVVKRWEHRRGGAKEFRPDHLAMSGTEVVGLDTPFVFPDGTQMLHAHDQAGGARHNINCGCDTTYYLRERVM